MEKCEAHTGIEARVENLEKSDSKQWSVIDRLQNRLPLWATIVLMVMSAGVGSALTYAALAAKLYQGIH